MSIPPADVLATALGEDPPAPSELEPVITSMVPLADAIRNTLASIALLPLATATPEERSQVVRLREEIARFVTDGQTWLDAIDLSWRRAAEAMGSAREIPTADGVVKIEPPRSEWRVDAAGLRRELEEFAKNGGPLSKEELTSIFTTVVQEKVDNTRLNYFARNRGEELAAIVARHRQQVPGNPMAAKVRFHRRADR